MVLLEMWSIIGATLDNICKIWHIYYIMLKIINFIVYIPLKKYDIKPLTNYLWAMSSFGI